MGSKRRAGGRHGFSGGFVRARLRGVPRRLPGIAGAVLCLIAGRALVTWADLPLPGAVAGLVLYAAVLLVLPPLRSLAEPGAALLTGLLGALIVPPFVGLVLFAPLLQANWQPVVAILILTTLLSGFVTAFLYRAMGRRG